MLAILFVYNTEWSFSVQMKLLVPEPAEQFVSLKEHLTDSALVLVIYLCLSLAWALVL